MRAQTLEMRRGGQWLKEGFSLYRQSPLALSVLVMAYWFTLLLLNVFPLVGTLAASLLMPGLSVGLMQAARLVERGQVPNIATLFGGLQENTRTLVALGALYLACTIAILTVGSLFEGGEIFSQMLMGRSGEAELPDPEALPVLVVTLLIVPMAMAYWFAPVLAAWHRQPLGKSLFFSFMACVLNWKPFLQYSLAVGLFCILLPGLFIGVTAALFPGLQSVAPTLVLMLMGTVVAPTVFASFYVIYRDIFGLSELA